MSENKFEFHFHAPVGQNIANVEHMDVHLDKDGQIQVMNAEHMGTLEEKPAESYCEYINREKLAEQNIYTLDEFETLFAKATKGEAPELAAFLHKYEKLGILDFKGHSKKKIYENLRAHFKEMREYSYTNFTAAY